MHDTLKKRFLQENTRNNISIHREQRTASAPLAPGAGAATGDGGGRLVTSPVLEPSLALTGQVLLQLHVTGLVQH